MVAWASNRLGNQSGTSSNVAARKRRCAKRCDQPVQVLIQKLESLILAQSERWRQA
jgi:hypothetical protein